MIGYFRRLLWGQVANLPPRRGQARAPCQTAGRRLHVEKLEERSLPGNILFGALLAPPWPSAQSPLDDAGDLAAIVQTSSWGAGGSGSAALASVTPGLAPNTPPSDLDALGGAAPTPIPETRTNPFGGPAIHFNKPGLPTDSPPIGNEPSTINNFNGFIGVVHATGTGTDGSGNALVWDADLRFMQGVYQGVDGSLHTGTFAFV